MLIGKTAEKTRNAIPPIRFTFVRRKLPCKVFSRRLFCACKNRFTEGIDMENTKNQTNLLSTDPGNLKREKISTIPNTLIDSANVHPFQVKEDD